MLGLGLSLGLAPIQGVGEQPSANHAFLRGQTSAGVYVNLRGQVSAGVYVKLQGRTS